jgi:predicted AAA+ superfamily ATPase
MHGYIPRHLFSDIKKDLALFPAVVITGPRQCGKSVLARKITDTIPGSIWLDLENPKDRARLTDPLLFLEIHADHLVCIDEIQLMPELFPLLRTEIDRVRRPGRFLLLGSASRVLINRSSESLAGRIAFQELTPFLPSEYLPDSPQPLLEGLSRGGFPESGKASSAEQSFRWRQAYIKSIIERDLPMLGSRIPSVAMERFLTMGAHLQGQLLNAAKLGGSLDLSGPAIRTRLNFLVEALFLRLLPPWEGNLKKRLVKSPKLYIRDTGLTHTLLNIESLNDLMAHPVWGASWEAYCIESICSTMVHWQASFYRTTGGAELDLVLEKGQRRLCFEFKASSVPTPGKGFYSAVEDLDPEHCYVVGFVEQPYPLAKRITVCNLLDCLERCK